MKICSKLVSPKFILSQQSNRPKTLSNHIFQYLYHIILNNFLESYLKKSHIHVQVKKNNIAPGGTRTPAFMAILMKIMTKCDLDPRKPKLAFYTSDHSIGQVQFPAISSKDTWLAGKLLTYEQTDGRVFYARIFF